MIRTLITLSSALVYIVAIVVIAVLSPHPHVAARRLPFDNQQDDVRGTFAPYSPTILPKLFPSNTDKEFMCPPNLAAGASPPPGYAPSNWNPQAVYVNHSLLEIVPDAASLNNVAVILIKRDTSNNAFFKYFGNGHENFAIETWSSSKIFEAMFAAGSLKMASCQTKNATRGLTQTTQGQFSPVTPLGDLISIIVSYATDYLPYCSNALAGFFSMLANRTRARTLVQTWWLNGGPNVSLGANYGATPPSDLKFTSFRPGRCEVQPSSYDNDGFSNTLSALLAAEMVKRIYLARELPPPQRFPNGTDWNDARTALYGADRSVLFPGLHWGGMSCNSEDGTRWGVDMAKIEARSNGSWRVFSKDGAGYSGIRLAGEVLQNGAACYSDVNNAGNGVEYIISSRVSVPGDTQLTEASARMVRGMSAINQAIVSGQLN